MSPSPDVLIRHCTHDDIPSLCELLETLFTQEAEFQPEAARQQRALRSILDSPGVGQLFCAQIGSNLAGMVSLLFTISTAEGGLVAWLEDLVVHPRWRGTGVGTTLLQAALAAASGAGCSRVTLLTDDNNVAAQRFYTRAGFARSPMVPFRLSLRR